MILKKPLQLCLLLIPLLLLVSCKFYYSGKKEPVATKGVLDLRQWDFQKDGPVQLRGEWEFFWKQLLKPDFEEGSRNGYINLPGNWNGYTIDGKPLQGDGYATYRLHVILPDNLDKSRPLVTGSHASVVVKNPRSPSELSSCRLLGLEFKYEQTAYNLFINGQLVTRVGRVGSSAETSVPEYRPHIEDVVVCEDRLNIVAQVSNYHHRKGGLEKEIILGLSHQISNKWENRRNYDLFLFGSILIMALYHFGLYFVRRKDRAPLYFGLFCAVVALRNIVVGQYFILKLVPGIDWGLLLKIEYLSLYLPLPVAVLFVHNLFPRELPHWLLKSAIVVTAACALSVIGPVRFFSQILIYFQVYLIAACFGLVVVFVVAVKRKREGAKPLLFGFIVLFLTVVNDILYNRMILPTSMLLPFGVFICILCQAYVLSARFSRAFSDVEYLSIELERRNKRLLELDKLKDEFVTNTSHELRTPLTGIIGLAEGLLDGAKGRLDGEAEQHLFMIISSGKRLASLVNDILDFSKLKYSDISLASKPLDLKAVTEMIVTFSGVLLGGKTLTLENNVPDSLPYVLADEDRLQQILMNLVGNAIKFTPEGTVSINAWVEKGSVMVSVKDTGIGIAEEKQTAIFESFEQADGSISREFGGSGLGLAVTRKLVELHGGELAVKSKPGEGSEFFFLLPVDDKDVHPTQDLPLTSRDNLPDSMARLKDSITEVNDDLAPGRSHKQTILVVDDEPVNIQVLQSQLRTAGFAVVSALDGYEALEKLKNLTPDLIILDLMMPRMTGYDLCTRIREDHPAVELPIIILTAKNRISDLVKGLDCGANDYIAKPFAKNELLSRIENQLKIQNYARELTRVKQDLEAMNQTLEIRVRERTGELSVKNDQMKQFLHILCHDLMNPFTSLSSAIELLESDSSMFGEMSDYMQTAVDNGIAIIGMVKQFRMLDEANPGQNASSHDLLDLILESEKMLSQNFHRKQLTLLMDVAKSTSVMVEKTSFINSVINNILTNAIKFSYPDSVIEIKASEINGKIAVSFRDYGIGIPQAILDNLFDLDKATSRSGTQDETGTGWGMPLVRSFVEAYGGKISVLSETEKTGDRQRGTEVVLTLRKG